MLAAFLADAVRTRFEWGKRDCCLFPADWVRLNRGTDPAAAYRGRYGSETECAAVLERGGGLAAVASAGAALAGLQPVEQPESGDVGVVRVLSLVGDRYEAVQVGAIFTGRRWAVLTPDGLLTLPAEPVMAWRV